MMHHNLLHLAEQEHKIVTGIVKRTTKDNIIVDLSGNAEGILPKVHALPRETFRPGDRGVHVGKKSEIDYGKNSTSCKGREYDSNKIADPGMSYNSDVRFKNVEYNSLNQKYNSKYNGKLAKFLFRNNKVKSE